MVRSESWHYSPQFVVRGDVKRHTGVWIGEEVYGIVRDYDGSVQMGVDDKEYFSIENALVVTGADIKIGSRVSFRFNTNGREMNELVEKLEEALT